MSSVVPPEKKLHSEQIDQLATKNSIKPAMLKSFFEVEGAGIGFSDYTGKMLIQFEPRWMEKFLTKGDGKPGAWINNGVRNQTLEYEALELAEKQNKEAAMKSTSIGIGQVMGFHFERLGFKTVEAMWTFADESELNQAEMVIEFIKTDKILYEAVKALKVAVIAARYNGEGYKELAKKLEIVPYDQQLLRALNKFSMQPGKSLITTTTVNLREGAGTTFNIIAPLRVNTAVQGISVQNQWEKVEVMATGKVGWVFGEYLKAA